jgi:hypothetical protein
MNTHSGLNCTEFTLRLLCAVEMAVFIYLVELIHFTLELFVMHNITNLPQYDR